MSLKTRKEWVLVSVAELAEFFGGITTTHVQKLEREGIVKKTARGKYDLKASTQNYIRYLKRSKDEDTYNGQRTRYYRAKADTEEIKAAALKGEFHHADCITAVMNEGLAVVRSRFLAIPTAAAPILADTSDKNECVAILTDLIHDALRECSKYDGRKVIVRYLKQSQELPEENTEKANPVEEGDP